MLKTVLTAAVIATIVPASGALAQNDAPKYDKLKRVLEQKFNPSSAQRQQPAAEEYEGATRSLSSSGSKSPGNPPEAVQIKKRPEYNWLKVQSPDAKDGVTKDRAKDVPPDRRGAAQPIEAEATKQANSNWFSSVIASVSGKVFGTGRQVASDAPDQTFAFAAMTGAAAAPAQSTAQQPSPVQVAQAAPGSGRASEAPPAAVEAPVSLPNSYVIQLKPDASEEDIAKLLEKYNLNVTKVIGELGVITVESNTDAGGTRSLGGPGAAPEEAAPSTPAQAKQQLERMLEPPLIKELRGEGIVDAAIVNSTIGTKALRHPSGATLQGGGKTYEWTWGPPQAADGNWGLKAIRVPPVWSMLDRHRKNNPGAQRPKIGVIDLGFSASPNVKFQSIYGNLPVTGQRPDCSTNHGMHVAGIIGAAQGATPGIDGIIPGARLDAIGISNQASLEAGNLGVEELWQLQTLVFDEVLSKTMDYLVDNITNPDGLRVINISLGYNFLAKRLIGNESLDDVSGLKLHIHSQASILRTMARRVEDKVLFVVAAGNDSEGRTSPLEARWSSPFAWAGTYESTSDKPAKNIIVVEAIGRDGQRAAFSNVGGHLAAPGVDIMSTLAASGQAAFGVCSGTSQAAPHVAALAAIMFEMDPLKKPADIVAALKASATAAPAGSPAAPTIDALEAVLALSRANDALLADLDGDGKVGPGDLAVFKRQAAAIEAAATTNAAFTEDLNGDGAIDDNECFWPAIDLNGSGAATLYPSGLKRLAGLIRSDLQILGYAWQGASGSFEAAVTEAGIAPAADAEGATAAANSPAPGIGPQIPQNCRGTVATSEAIPVATPVATQTPVPPPPPATVVVSGNTNSTTASETTAPGALKVVEDRLHVAENLVANPASVRKEVQGAIEALKKENPKLRVTINPATGLPSSISGFTPKGDASSAAVTRSLGEPNEDDVRRVVEGFFETGGLAAAAPDTRAFATHNRQAVTKMTGKPKKDPDFPDRTVATVEQRIDGIPVFGSSGKVTLDQLGAVSKVTLTASQVAIDDTKPELTETAAIEAARTKLRELIKGGRDLAPIPLAPDVSKAKATAKLTVFDPAIVDVKSKGATRLAYLVAIESFRLFVDANTGEVFYNYRDQPSGMLRRIFDLGRSTAFPGTKVADEETREVSENLNADSMTAFHNGGVVRDYFFMLFGRAGYDSTGSVLESYVRYGSLSNAYWCPQQSYSCPKANVMVYGPGYAEAVDIVGHEVTHGIISHEKNLLYLNESGAVNESLADIFGTLIEQYASVPRANWVIGEKLPGFSEAAPMRSMSDPNLKDRDGKSMFQREVRYSMSNRGQPDHYAEVLTPLDPLCGKTRLQDNGCVHFNSGILNKFAYLVSEGGEHRGGTVEGIGRVKLARLAYRTMTVQLNQSSKLVDAAEGFVLSCRELAEEGRANLTTEDCDQVEAAQQAVGLVFANS